MTTTMPTPPAGRPVWRRYVDIFLRQLSRGIDHEEVVEHVRDEGHITGRYIFMSVMSCAVATLGLLLSSPAVIIGAMLISPLMGPIMLMGFSLTILEWPSLRRAIFAQVCGVLAALAIAVLIVWLSPLKEATPEILSRTRPNLFDLMVAVFSGLAGGYAVIHRKGETIVGVAIATALMPPLAVTGYGLAVLDMTIAGGAFFLFMTNLLAIAFCVVGLSKLYSFGEEHSPQHTLWQSALIISVFAALSLPLGVALRDIAFETTISNAARGELLEPFEGAEARVSDFAVSFPNKDQVRVNATVLTRAQVGEADTWLEDVLERRFARDFDIQVDQVLINEDKALEAAEILELAETSLAAPLRAEIERLRALADSREASQLALREAVPFRVRAADIDAEARRAVIVAAPSEAFDLAGLRAVEENLAVNMAEWTIEVVPPVRPLPAIPFAAGEAELSEAAETQLVHALWALTRWQVHEVEVIGRASSAGSPTLAAQRADIVAERLRSGGFIVAERTELGGDAPASLERERGRDHFRSAVIRPTGGP